MYPSKKYCLIILGCLFFCQILYTMWLSLSQGDVTLDSMQHNGFLVSPRMVTASLNKSLTVTKKTFVTSKSRPTRKKHPTNNNKKSISDDNLVMPDSVQHGFVEQHSLSIKNVPLHFSDVERQGPVMPAPVMHDHEYTNSKSHKTRTDSAKGTQAAWLKTYAAKKQVKELVSQIFSQNSTESPPEDIIEHFQLHSKKMARFCIHHNHSLDLPQDNYTRQELYHHLLYDDSKRIIFCYVPKSGCSNWKRMFAVLNGTVKADDTDRPSKRILQSVNKLEYLSETEQITRLKHYFKFSFVRSPLERIVSGYRNKIAVPINYANRNHWPDRILFQILKMYEKPKYKEWSKTNFTSADFYPSFEGFIQYLTSAKLASLNEHFRPFMELCQPCSINYNFIGNFYNLPDEAYRITSFLGIPRKFYLNRVEHPSTNTSSIVPLYYDTISVSLKVRLLQKFSQELLMYYLLYPAEAKRDLEMLGLTQYMI